MHPGVALDKTLGWDVEIQEAEARKVLEETRPKVLVGSPECKAFSQLLSLSKSRMKTEEYDALVQEGLQHLNFAIDLYYEQMARGDDFLHEHPHPASSWNLSADAGVARGSSRFLG